MFKIGFKPIYITSPYRHIASKLIKRIKWITLRQRIHTQKPSHPWVIHPKAIILLVGLAFDFVVVFFAVVAVAVVLGGVAAFAVVHHHAKGVVVLVLKYIGQVEFLALVGGEQFVVGYDDGDVAQVVGEFVLVEAGGTRRGCQGICILCAS